MLKQEEKTVKKADRRQEKKILKSQKNAKCHTHTKNVIISKISGTVKRSRLKVSLESST